MTIRDIFSHFISLRWQFAGWCVALASTLILDAIFGSFDTLRAYLIDAEGAAVILLLLANAGWALLKLCIAFPVIGDILFWIWWLDL